MLREAADLLDPPAWQPPGRPDPLPHQQPPAGPFKLWLLEGGRGSGKTEACARYFAAYMRAHPGSRGRIIAPTMGDAVQACVEGPSGLLEIDPEVTFHGNAVGGAEVRWSNGSEALVLGTFTRGDVERLRAGGNRHLDWWEEMSANPQLARAWDQAQLGLRLGPHPHSVGSTTPRPTTAYKHVRGLPGTVLTHATTDDNPYNSEEWRQTIRDRYASTRLGRQELQGELIEDAERALVKRSWIERARVDDWPQDLVRSRAVGLDPGGEGARAMVCCAHSLNHLFYVIRSEMVEDSATDSLRHAVRIAHGLDAMIVVEKNHGGDYLVELLTAVQRELDLLVPVKVVWASAGKQARAEPSALLVEQDKVRFVGAHPHLEDQLCTWEPDSGEASPHLLDAWVWAMDGLRGSGAVGHEQELAAVPFQ